MDDHQLVTPTMTEDTGEQKRPAQESDDNDVTKRKRQVKIKFIQTYHFVQFEIQHLNQM
jgi:hypothetical protein